MPSAIATRMYCVNLLDICDPPRFSGGRIVAGFLPGAINFAGMPAKFIAPGSKPATIRPPEKRGGSQMSSRFTQYILVAMALGIVMGALVFNYLPDQRVEIAADVNLIEMLFLRLH